MTTRYEIRIECDWCEMEVVTQSDENVVEYKERMEGNLLRMGWVINHKAKDSIWCPLCAEMKVKK